MTVREVVTLAKRNNWTPDQLAVVLKGLPRHVYLMLLDGAAVVADETPDGRFTIYEPA